jgi:hypothetical protein
VRGTREGSAFELRTVWPDDFSLSHRPPTRSIDTSPVLAMRALMRETPEGGSRSPYAAWTLWQRDDAADWSDRPVLGLIVNGAQGDDDEAHGGHFALVTGRVQADGQIGDWLVNNFYSLDVESEKGILAAPVPLDNYLADLNSGQGWYRPSYMVVAVLKDERAAVMVQSALNRVYNQFWRHQLVYYHPNENCASISIDALRALGWNIPRRGPTSRTLAWLGFPLFRRCNREIQLTDEGVTYLPAVRAALNKLRSATESLVHRDYEGLLCISTTESFATNWLIARLEALRGMIPEDNKLLISEAKAKCPLWWK